jgi:hypothetical protein
MLVFCLMCILPCEWGWGMVMQSMGRQTGTRNHGVDLGEVAEVASLAQTTCFLLVRAKGEGTTWMSGRQPWTVGVMALWRWSWLGCCPMVKVAWAV